MAIEIILIMIAAGLIVGFVGAGGLDSSSAS